MGVLKLMKIAVETQRFMEKLKAEGRTKYNIKEYYDEVVFFMVIPCPPPHCPARQSLPAA